ncbi:MAG: hypothetical protein KDC92_08620 [Bacteroidetes bacterium]|nr:hypothetical protein [Bacteroidota bacterium]
MSPSKTILIADDSPQWFLDKLLEAGHTLIYEPELTNEQMHATLNNYQVVLIKSALILNRSFFENHSELKLILRPGSGLDNIDKTAALEFGVEIINTPEGNCNAVGEHVVGLLLNMANHIPKAIHEVRNSKWIREENRGFELEGKTIGIIGVGNTGTAVYKKLEGFDMIRLPHDKYKPWIETIKQNSASLNELFERAEVVTLHLPLNHETRHYASSQFFSLFKKPIHFINASRGGVLDENALLHALETGKVLSAALDVLEFEPPSIYQTKGLETFYKLVNHPKIIITPHIAGWTHEAKFKMFDGLLKKWWK